MDELTKLRERVASLEGENSLLRFQLTELLQGTGGRQMPRLAPSAIGPAICPYPVRSARDPDINPHPFDGSDF